MIELRSSSLRVLVSPFGATLAGLWSVSHPHSLVIGCSDQYAYAEHLSYFGAIVGPVANRIAGGKVMVDGKEWLLEQNEGDNTLHSGSDGLHAQMWNVVETSKHRAVFTIDLAHGFGGLPGHRKIKAIYAVAGSMLRLEISAISDAATVMNIAHHPYWNLDGAETIAAHHLCIPADNYLPTTDTSLPAGEIASVEGTDYDFQEARPIPTTTKLDANLCLSRTRFDQPRKCADLSTPSGPRLEVHSTEPGLQLYNGFGLGDLPASLFDERKLTPCAGVALEPQGWPDACGNNHFPSIYLHAGSKYRQITEYRIYQ